jgi:hypothetical protein
MHFNTKFITFRKRKIEKEHLCVSEWQEKHWALMCAPGADCLIPLETAPERHLNNVIL